MVLDLWVMGTEWDRHRKGKGNALKGGVLEDDGAIGGLLLFFRGHIVHAPRRAHGGGQDLVGQHVHHLILMIGEL